MKFNNKKIITVLLVLLIVLVMLAIIFNFIKKDNNKKIDLAISTYNKIHTLYLSGNGIEYVYDDANNRRYIEEDNNKYYEIKNKDLFTNLISEKSLDKLLDSLNIKEKDDKYYISDFGRGISNYYGTKFKIKHKRKNKIEYIAISTFCKKDFIVYYGDRCMIDGYYEIEKPFTLVKEDGVWKVLEYTSIFQFSDRELK